jgi:hypothetical protein
MTSDEHNAGAEDFLRGQAPSDGVAEAEKFVNAIHAWSENVFGLIRRMAPPTSEPDAMAANFACTVVGQARRVGVLVPSDILKVAEKGFSHYKQPN